MKPRAERVTIETGQIAAAVVALEQTGTLPDGTEVATMKALRACCAQLRRGFYYRLVFPAEATDGEIAMWLENALEIVKLHNLGLV